MASVNELRASLTELTGLVAELTRATVAAVAEAPAPPPATTPQSDIQALASAITGASAPKEHHGQTVRPATFDPVHPGDEQFALPAEPRYPPDHATIVKNESQLFKHLDRNRVDPRKASRSHWDKTFQAKVNSPFKNAVFDYPSYEDYIRNTDMVYAGMCVFYSRLTPDGTNKDWIDDESPIVMWNAFTKETLKVKRDAFTGDGVPGGRLGFTGYLDELRRRLDKGENLELPKAVHRELYDKIDAHNKGPKSAKFRPVLPEHQDWGVQLRNYAKNDDGTPKLKADGSLFFEYGGYDQVNQMFDRNVVLSKGEFRALALVLGDAYHKFCSKGETHETGRTDELLCAEAQSELSRTLPPNYLYEIRQSYFDAYPESQRDLVMRIRGAAKGFRFDRSAIKLSMYINQWQLAQASLLKHGARSDAISDDDILKDLRTVLHAHYTTLPPEQQDTLNLEYKTLAESDAQLDVLSSDHRHKHVFDSLTKFKQEVLRIEDLHPHVSRLETVPDYLYVPTPKEPTPLPRAANRFYYADDFPSDASRTPSDDPDTLMSMGDDLTEALLAGRLDGTPMARYAAKNAGRGGPRDLRAAEARRHDSEQRRRSSHSPGGYHDSTPHLGGHPHSSRGGEHPPARFNKMARALSKAHNDRRSASVPPPRSSLRRSDARPSPRSAHAPRERPAGDRDRERSRAPSDGRREYIPKKPYLALRRVIELAQKAQAAPATSENNLKEAAEVCGEALKLLADDGVNVLDDDDPPPGDDPDDDHADAPAELSADTRMQAATEAGFSEPGEAAKFTALYEQIQHIDRDLSPADLYQFTVHAMSELERQDHAQALFSMIDTDDATAHEDHSAKWNCRSNFLSNCQAPQQERSSGSDAVSRADHGERQFGPEYKSDYTGDGKPDDDAWWAKRPSLFPLEPVDVPASLPLASISLEPVDVPASIGAPKTLYPERTKASSVDLQNLEEALALSSDTHVGRHELYDSGATNMFRQAAINPIPGSERSLTRTRRVAAADKGIVAERTYLETYNLLSNEGHIYSIIVSPLICPLMNKSMTVSSAHKLNKLGFGHSQEPFDPYRQALSVGKPHDRAHVPLLVMPSGLPMLQLIDDEHVARLVADGARRLNPDNTPYSQRHAMQMLTAHWNTIAPQSSSSFVHQITVMCNEFSHALESTTRPSPTLNTSQPTHGEADRALSVSRLDGAAERGPEPPRVSFARTNAVVEERDTVAAHAGDESEPSRSAAPKDDDSLHPHSDAALTMFGKLHALRESMPYHKTAEEIMSRWIKPSKVIRFAQASESVILTTTVLCCGILSSFYFDVKQRHDYALPIKIVRYCEKDDRLFGDIAKRLPEADGHRDLRNLVAGLRNRVWDRGKFYTDIVEVTAVCYDNTILNQLNNTSDHPDADLFLLSVEYIALVKPKYAFSEMTPMHEFSFVPHYDVIDAFKRAGYIPMAVDRAPSAFVDGTNRDRWICFARSDTLPVRRWTTNLLDTLSHSEGIASAEHNLLPPEAVPPELWERRRVERRPGGELRRHNGFPSDPRVTGKYITRACISGWVEGMRFKETKSFDIRLGPMPTITSWAMSRVHDDRPGSTAPDGVEDRYCDLAEFAAATSFLPQQYDYLQTLSFDHALKIIAAAVPVGLLHAIYLTIVAEHMLHLDDNVSPLAYVIDAGDSALALSDAHNDVQLPFDFENFELPPECFCHMNMDDLGADDDTLATSSFELDDTTSAPVPEQPVEPRINDDQPLNVTTGKRLRVSRASWPPEHPVGSTARRNAVTRITKLHNIYHVNNEILEKVILLVKGHGCKPGDTRYLGPCAWCQSSTDATPRHHATPGTSRERLVDVVPGQKWMIDGGDATTRSRWGSFRYFMVAVDCKSGYLVVYPMVDNSARSFMSFVTYLRNITKLRCGIYPSHLYGDYFSTHLSHLVAQMRISLGIQLEAIPPYMHHLNPYAEGLMRILKIGCVRRLPSLVGKVIYNEVVKEARCYWPWAMEHKVQSYNLQPNAMLERDLGYPCTPISVFDSKTSDDVNMNLHEFGSNVLVVMQRNQRISDMDSPTWPAVYLFSGAYNPFTHIYANAPRAHVVVKQSGQLQITGRALFPDADLPPKAARQETIDEPGTGADSSQPRACQDYGSFPSGTAGKTATTTPDPENSIPGGHRVNDSRILVGPSPPDTDAQPKHSPFSTVEPTAEKIPAATSPLPVSAPTPQQTRVDSKSSQPASVEPSTASDTPGADGDDIVPARPEASTPSRAPHADVHAAPQRSPARAISQDFDPATVLEPMRIPPPDLLVNDTTHRFKIVGSKRGKSALRFDMYKSATTPAEFFRLHPGRTAETGNIRAADDWKNDVRKGLIVFDDAKHRELASSYGMQGEELATFLDEHPEEYDKAFARSQRNLLRCFTMSVADELDLTPDEVCHIQSSNTTATPKVTRNYFETIDLDETVHDSVIYHLVMMGAADEVWLQVEYNKNRDVRREREKVGESYVPQPADLVIEEGRLQDLKTITDPVERARMVKAIIKEISDLLAIGTFELVPVPQDRQAIKSRIVLKVKYLADGTYNKHKARLVAKGFMQRLGVDFFSVFSPMATLTTVRVLLALAVSQGFDVIHADIPQAFVQSILDVDVWLMFPDGITVKGPDGRPNKVVKLIRSLYGLRNAPQLWNKALTHFFVNKLNYTQASSDGCLFYKVTKAGYVLVACEVDDLVITGSDKAGIAELKSMLTKQYSITDWGPISSFLGINMNYTDGVLEMDVVEKIRDLFSKHGIINSTHNIPGRDVPLDDDYTKIPVEEGSVKYTELDLYLEENFASIVGALIYISITARPDLAFAIGKLSRGMHKPNPRHIAMLKHTLGYIRRTQEFKMVYKRKGNAVESLFRDLGRQDVAMCTLSGSDNQNLDPLGGFSDANFANKSDEQTKSISGYCFFLFGCMVSWRSKLQTLTAASTFESELIALAFAANEAIWIRKLLHELSFALGPNVHLRNKSKVSKEIDPDSVLDFDRHGDDVPATDKVERVLAPTPVAVDNKAVEFAVNNPETSQRTRHLDTRYFKIRDYVRDQDIRVRHIGTKYNPADFFTKGLARQDFQRYRGYLGMEDHTKTA